jgi:hypothetical protein
VKGSGIILRIAERKNFYLKIKHCGVVCNLNIAYICVVNYYFSV